MTFGSPVNFLWLLPVCGGIIALWMLRVRRKEQTVSSLYLWRRVTPTAKADTPLQRLRRNLLLFLQLLAAFLLVMALTHPMLRASGVSGERYVLIVDDSASMAATDVEPNRLAGAVQKAEQFVHDVVKPSDRVAVIVSAGAPRMAAGWTSRAAGVDAVLDAVAPTDIERDLPSAVTLARTQIGRKGSDAHIVIFSDGAWDTSDDDRIWRAAGDLPVSLVTTGTNTAANVGITGMDTRRDAFGTNERQIFVRVRNFGTTTVSGKLEMLVDAAPLSAETVRLPAGGATDAAFTGARLSAGGEVEARLTGFSSDTMLSDNSAFMTMPPDRRIRILLVSAGNLFLEKGLGLDPNVDLFETTPDRYASIHARYDLEVFDDFAPASLPPGNFLIFHAVSAGMPVVSVGDDVQAPAIVDWSETSPMMRFVDMTDVHFASAAHVQAANWGQTVVDGDQGPLVVAGERFGRRCVWVGATTASGDFPLKVAFPIFLTNAAQWLTDSSGSADVLHPGDPILLPSGSGAWRVRPPSSDPVTFKCGDDASQPCVYGDVERAGLYHFTGESRQVIYSANVESDRSSDIGARDHPGYAPDITAAHRALVRSERTDIWTLLAIVVLCLMIVEWLVYHRRS